MRRPVTIRVVRRFPHRPSDAYAWLTDFRDDDAQRTHAVVQKRRVKERSATRVVYEGETSVLGAKAWAVTEVTLHPPLRWEARVTDGPRKGSTTDYVMRERADGCDLAVTYRFVLADTKRHLALRALRPLVKRELARMWDGYTDDMAKELPPIA
jgi:hypothetical protein